MMWKFCFAISLLVSFSLCCVEATDEGCPEDSDIFPCHCYLSSGNIIVDCSKVASEDALLDALDAEFPVTDMYRLDILNNKYIPGFTKNVFGSLTFRAVKITNSDIEYINDPFFDNLQDSLESLTITNSRLNNDGFSFEILSSLINLNSLNVNGNFLSHIPPLPSTSITHIYFNNNGIETVDANAFQTSNGLTYIDLKDNFIEELDLYLFKGLFSLVTLYLDHNEITKFQSGQFTLLTSLNKLQIGYNPTTIMEQAVFVNLPNLKTLNMHDLKIYTLPLNMFFNVPILETWNMNYGELDKIDSNVFISFLKLTDLELKNNYFTTIKTGQFKGITAPGSIYLSYNDISVVQTEAFPDLESSELYLDHNEIETLDATWLQSILDQQNSVSVEHNPITCGCDLAWIFEDTAYLDQFLGSPTCSDGSLLKDLNQDYFIENCV